VDLGPSEDLSQYYSQPGGKGPALGLVSYVRSTIEIASPPAKALMIYDGDCNFCSLWVHRWQHTTGDHLDYLPFQDPHEQVSISPHY
jgi:hypothetical protein